MSEQELPEHRVCRLYAEGELQAVMDGEYWRDARDVRLADVIPYVQLPAPPATPWRASWCMFFCQTPCERECLFGIGCSS